MANFGEDHNRFDLIPEYQVPQANSKNRKWVTQEGIEDAGGGNINEIKTPEVLDTGQN